MRLKDSLNRGKDFKRREEAGQHQYNIAHMHRRIIHSYSLTERKKNHLDPQLYPSLLMRRDNEILTIPPPSTPRYLPPNSARSHHHPSAAASGSMTARSRASSRGAGASPLRSLQRPSSRGVSSRASTALSHLHPSLGMPPTSARSHSSVGHSRKQGGGTSVYTYKTDLVDEIVERRLYEEKELTEFLEMYAEQHRSEQGVPADLAEAMRQLREELELHGGGGRKGMEGESSSPSKGTMGTTGQSSGGRGSKSKTSKARARRPINHDIERDEERNVRCGSVLGHHPDSEDHSDEEDENE